VSGRTSPDHRTLPTGRGAPPRPAGTTLPLTLLVDLPNWVGDLAMALPLVGRLVSSNAPGRTILHARPSAGRLLRAMFPTAAVATVPPKTSPFTAARRVVHRGGRVDLGISLRNAWRAKIFLRLVARRAWGSASSGGWMLDRTVTPDPRRHQRHDWDGFLEALDLDPIVGAPLSTPRELCREGRGRLADVSSGEVVGLAPGAAGWDSKRWSPDRFGALARRLADGGRRPVVVVGPGEQQVAARVTEASGVRLPVVGADTDVAGLAGLVSELDLVVGNDSGPVQLAAVFGTPVVAIFGPTDPDRTRPVGAAARVVRRPLECAPCRRSTCPLGHHACMTELSVEEVMEAVDDLVG